MSSRIDEYLNPSSKRSGFTAAHRAEEQRQVRKSYSQNENNGLQAKSGANNPPYCNTGGYGFKKIPASKRPSSITKIDWLRATVQDVELFRHTLSSLEGVKGIFASANVEVFWTEKGLHGYDKSAKLFIRTDDEVMTMGHIATAERGRNEGGMLELTGKGCQWLQLNYWGLWLEIMDLLESFEWRLSRVDIALDLPGQYCEEMNYSVPKLFRSAVYEKLFQSEKLRNPNMKQSYSMAGDWSSLTIGTVTPDSYDPLIDCPAGLTAYVGSRKGSADFFRIYEKGKELLGSAAEPESIDRAWVRIEHEMSRKGTGREMPINIMIKPDEYFCIDRPAVREIMNLYRESLALDEKEQVQLSNYNREKGLSLGKKMHWAKFSYGRLFKTMVDKGHEYEKIIEWLSRDKGLKEFIDDFEFKEAA